MATQYKITATFTRNGKAGVDCSTPEVLGDAHGRTYHLLEAAQEVVADLEESTAGDGLDPSTRYWIEAVED